MPIDLARSGRGLVCFDLMYPVSYGLPSSFVNLVAHIYTLSVSRGVASCWELVALWHNLGAC